MKYYALSICLYASLASMDRPVNYGAVPLLPISRLDIENDISDRRWNGITNITQGFAAKALGAGFVYAASTGTGDAVMVPIMYAGGVGFLLAGVVISANGFRKLCCGAARLCGKKL